MTDIFMLKTKDCGELSRVVVSARVCVCMCVCGGGEGLNSSYDEKAYTQPRGGECMSVCVGGGGGVAKD